MLHPTTGRRVSGRIRFRGDENLLWISKAECREQAQGAREKVKIKDEG
jgi:hypothetical protein